MIDLVIPTIGRESLRDLLVSISSAHGPLPRAIFVVDDRQDRRAALDFGPISAAVQDRIEVLAGRAAGPAAARNIGWRASRAEWIAFLDDDVVVEVAWLTELARDLTACAPDVAGSSGRIDVPLPLDRKPTDWERNVAGLAEAQWITADCAYRRAALQAVGGFDERFPRAYREDADLALRIVKDGSRIVAGQRRSIHPVRKERWDVSIRAQAGNADDVLMEALHGSDWYGRARASRGTFGRYVPIVVSAAVAVVAAGVWLAGTLAFAFERIAPGPRTAGEVVTMLATSVVIPFAAVRHRIAGYWGLRTRSANRRPRAVLFDRDGTLVVDVAYNGDPDAVAPMAGAQAALASLRAAGIATAIVSNQSGIALGKLSVHEVDAVNARLDALVGPFDAILYCPHDAAAGCACRKPAPGLILAAAAQLGVLPAECVVIGDIGSDIAAAEAAGARAILVPTPVTLPAQIAAAPQVAPTLEAAIDRILAGRV